MKNIDMNSLPSVDFRRVKNWEYFEEGLIKNATESCNSIENVEAKTRELQNWKDHSVYEEAENEGQEVVSVRWVITEKRKKKADLQSLFSSARISKN